MTQTQDTRSPRNYNSSQSSVAQLVTLSPLPIYRYNTHIYICRFSLAALRLGCGSFSLITFTRTLWTLPHPLTLCLSIFRSRAAHTGRERKIKLFKLNGSRVRISLLFGAQGHFCTCGTRERSSEKRASQSYICTSTRETREFFNSHGIQMRVRAL